MIFNLLLERKYTRRIFHTFNSLVGQSKQIIISGDRAPSDLDGLEERLRSRLSFGLVGEIHKADYELRLSILHTKIEAKKDISCR